MYIVVNLNIPMRVCVCFPCVTLLGHDMVALVHVYVCGMCMCRCGVMFECVCMCNVL